MAIDLQYFPLYYEHGEEIRGVISMFKFLSGEPPASIKESSDKIDGGKIYVQNNHGSVQYIDNRTYKIFVMDETKID